MKPVLPLSTRRTPHPSAVLAVAAFGAFLAFLDSTIVNVAFPDIAESFPDASIGELSWVLNSYNIVFAAFLVVAGRLADLLGRRRTFVWGVLLFTATSAACAAAGSLEQLIAFRVLQGLGAALLVPASLALVVEGFDEEHRAHGIGLWGAAAAMAAGLGPPIGGALVASADWRWAFLVNVPLGLLAVVVARRVLVESRAPGRRRVPDLRGALLLAISLGLVTLALVRGHDWGWTSAATLGALLAGAVAVAGFVLSSRAHPAPILDPALMRLRSFSLASILTVVAGAGFYAYLLTHILFLTYVWDYSLLKAGLAVAPAAFVAAVVAARLGKVADRHGHRLIVVPGALVWAASFLWYIEQVGSTPDLLGAWLPGQVLSGIGVGATLPVLGSAGLAAVPNGVYGTASAVISSARQLGAVLGIAVLVVLVGTPLPGTVEASLRDGWTFSALCFLAVAVGALALRHTPPGGKSRSRSPPPSSCRPRCRSSATRSWCSTSRSAGDRDPRRHPCCSRDVPARRPLRPGPQHRPGAAAGRSRAVSRRGDRSDALYVVLRGRLSVTRGDQPGSEVGPRHRARGARPAHRRPPLRHGPRRARQHAAAPVGGTARRGRGRQHLPTLARGLASRLQQVEPPRKPATAAGVIAVIGAGADAPVDEVSRALVRHLGTWLDAADPGRVDAEQLERAEQRHQRVLLTAPYTGPHDPWRDFCLRACDRVVLVSAEPMPSQLDHPRLQGADLVLPREAARSAWVAAAAPRSVHAYDGSASLRPLAARLAQRSLGLVLGGGGARAFAHLGVLEELEAAGIEVGRIAGASVGAAIAALHAAGRDAAAVDAHVYEYFVRTNPLGDWTLPTRSLVRGRATLNGLERTFGDLAIEELPKEFRCVSVDLLKRTRVVHDRGRVATAVAASLRLPGLYPPLLLDGRLHVDGGVLDNLPVTTLTAQPEGPVVAVSISFGGGGGTAPPVAGRRACPGSATR
jgi:EmrB/QacA subfamily drug resistance transporter